MKKNHYHSVCPLDCPDTCSLDVHVEGGKIAAIDASPLNPVTGGFICSKVRDFAGRVYDERRLSRPLRRSGPKGSGRFEAISWDDAIGEIHKQFTAIRDEHGSEAIVPFSYDGSNGFLTGKLVDTAFFRRLGASRLDQTVCATPSSAAAAGLYGAMGCADMSQAADAKHIILWGGNPRASNIHIMPYLKEAKARGATITQVDPRRTLSQDLIDLHLPVRPGTDLVLALAMIAWLDAKGLTDPKFIANHTTGFEKLIARAREYTPEKASEITGVPAIDIRTAAERYAAADPALIRCGWGPERNRNGESATAAILAIPAVAGKFGVRGSGYILSTNRGYHYDGERAIGVPPSTSRLLNMSRLATLLNEPISPPIKALFVYNCNPAVTMPDQAGVIRGLEREDLFTVVFEQVMTDTAQYADIILPATTFLEHTEVKRTYGSYSYMYAPPVIRPLGEAKPNYEVFGMLGKTFGFDDDIFSLSADELAERVIAAIGDRVRGTLDRDGESWRGKRLSFDFPGENPIPFDTVFPEKPERRVDLFPESLGENIYRYIPLESDRFPLALISPSSAKMISSTFGERGKGLASVEIHPDDAAPRGIAAGGKVRVFNQLGSVVVLAKVSESIRPGVLSIHKGLWRDSSESSFTASALAPDNVTIMTGAATFNDARVEVEPLPPEEP